MEKNRNIDGLLFLPTDTVLLDCLGTLASNELFSDSDGELTDEFAVRTTARIFQSVMTVHSSVRNLIVISNEVFSDGITYDRATELIKPLDRRAMDIASAPQNFTNLLLGYYANGQNCGINVLCRAANVDLQAVDMGVIGKVESPNLMDFKLMEGTRNFAAESAMTRETAEKAIAIGISLAKHAYDNGYKIIGTGEVGIGNTSSSAACTMAALNLTADEAVGRGAGLSDEAYAHKKEVLTRAVALHAPFADEIDIIAKVGGLDIAGLTGIFIGAAIYRLPVIIDGFISAVAAMFAFRINPLAMQIVDASLQIMSDMLSFDASGRLTCFPMCSPRLSLRSLSLR